MNLDKELNAVRIKYLFVIVAFAIALAFDIYAAQLLMDNDEILRAFIAMGVGISSFALFIKTVKWMSRKFVCDNCHGRLYNTYLSSKGDKLKFVYCPQCGTKL